jgi:lactate dehydrogenase-like 2-hydroxyacid dehydrogenase
MSKQIYCTRPIHETGLALLREKGYELTMGESGQTPDHSTIITALQQKPYDAVVAFLTDTVNKELFDACPTAKIFANYSVGFNNVNLKEAEESGVTITNTAGTAGLAVAEHTVALTLAVTARIAEGDEYMKSGKYTGWQPDLLIGTDVSGKTVGLIGLGDIGSQAGIMFAKGFGCTLLYSDLHPNETFEKECGARFVSREEIFKNADIISLHVPLLPTTTHLINSESISLMKSNVIIINTSRGPVVDENALFQALKDKRIYGAGLDVYEFEPHVVEGLTALPNVVLTPHIASARESVRSKMAKLVADNIISFFETGTARTPVKG